MLVGLVEVVEDDAFLGHLYSVTVVTATCGVVVDELLLRCLYSVTVSILIPEFGAARVLTTADNVEMIEIVLNRILNKRVNQLTDMLRQVIC